MKNNRRKNLSLLIIIIIIISAITPAFTFAEQTNGEQALENVWEVLEQAEADAIAQGLDDDAVISAVKQAALNCELVLSDTVEDGISKGFSFTTVSGLNCIYEGTARNVTVEVNLNVEDTECNSNNTELEETISMQALEEMYAEDTNQAIVNADSESARNVLVVQPFVDFEKYPQESNYTMFEDASYTSDGNEEKYFGHNSYARNIAQKIANYTGGKYTLLFGENATITSISKALDDHGIVIFDTHGWVKNDSTTLLKLSSNIGFATGEVTYATNGYYFDCSHLLPQTKSRFDEGSIFFLSACSSLKKNDFGNLLINNGATCVVGTTENAGIEYLANCLQTFFDSLIDDESSMLAAFVKAANITTGPVENAPTRPYLVAACADKNDIIHFYSNIPDKSDHNEENEDNENDVVYETIDNACNSILNAWKLIKSTDIKTESCTIPLYEEVSNVEFGESYLLTYKDQNNETYIVSSVMEEVQVEDSNNRKLYKSYHPYITEVEKTENTTDNTVSFSVKDSSAECGTNVEAFELAVFPLVADSNNVALFNKTVQKYLALGTGNKPTYTQNKYEWQVSNGKLKAASSNNTYVVPQTTAVSYYAYYPNAPHENGTINIDRLASINSSDSEFQFTLYKRINPDEKARKIGQTTGADINFRHGPSTVFNSVHITENNTDVPVKLPKCQKLIIYDCYENWWYASPVENLSLKGWVYGNFVSVTGEINNVITTARANKSSKFKDGMNDGCADRVSINKNTNLNIYYVEGEWCYASTIADPSVKGWIPRADLDYYGTYPISDVIKNIANTAMSQYFKEESMPTSITFNGMTLNSSAITLLMARTLLALENGETQVRVEESFNEMPAQTYQNYLTYNSFDSSEINKAGYLYAAQKCVEYYNQYHRLPNYVMFPGSSNLQGYNGRFSSLLANIVFVKAVHRANTQLPGSVETSTNYYQAPSSSAKPSPVPTEPPALSMNLQSGGSTFTVIEIAQAATGILEHYERYAAYPGEYSVAKGVVIKRGDTEYCITDQDWAYMAGYALAGYTGSWSASNLSGYTLDTEIVYRKANKPARSANATYVVGNNATPTSVSADKVVEMAWKGSDYADEKRAVGEGTTMSGCCYSAFSGYQVTYYSILIASARMLKYIADNNGNLPQSVAYNAIDYKVTDTDTWGA